MDSHKIPRADQPSVAQRRIFVSVSTKGRHWHESPEVILGTALELVREKNTLSFDTQSDTSPRLLVVEKWGSRTHIVFDVFHAEYDSETAHIPGQNNLPVITVSLSATEKVQVADPSLETRVNEEVREIHRLHAPGIQPPFIVDHTGGKIPEYNNPRA